MWAPVAGASSYEVELVRADTVVYARSVDEPRLTLPASWSREGTTYRQQPEDELFVWAIVEGKRAADPVVDGVLALDLTDVANGGG